MRIHTLDLEYLGTPGAIAAYVLEAPAGPVLIETGPGSTVERLSAGLAGLGMTPSDIGHVLVTHIHFDHAGAAGWMAQQGAMIHAHEFGAPHLVDPAKLIASATRVYGDTMAWRWGEILPVPGDRMHPVHHGNLVDVGGVRLRAIESPGHARHHLSWALDLPDDRVCFTGDAAACFVEEVPEFVSIPIPPPEFQLAAWLATLDRLRHERFDRLFPTHFGEVTEPRAHLDRVERALREHAAYTRTLLDEGVADDDIRTRYRDWWLTAAQGAGLPEEKTGFYVLDTLADMNVTGMLRYWRKAEERLGAGAR